MAVVTPEEVAVRISLARPLTPEQRAVIQDAIDDALATVTAHLHTFPVPRLITEHGVLRQGDSWAVKRHPIVEIVSATAETSSGEPTGRYTVVYRAGLDPDADPDYGAALRRYVLGHAAAMPHIVQLSPNGRRVKSASLEGQSVTYTDDPQAGSGAAGAPPTLTSLSYWRVLSVHQPDGIAPHPLGYTSWP
ncbi:hypothetical protein [Streptosporangium sp. NPDC051022]|uniref:hypothetical protein n=1 Tax=Streptosporangium sp. NPDC051022 TaxID=3155752 RepID=UPI0034125274